MKEQQIIDEVFGPKWDEMTFEEKEIAWKIFDWMYSNLGLIGGHATRDRYIIAAIQTALVECFGVTFSEIMAKTRKREKVEKRAMVYKVAKELTKSSTSKISKYFGRDRNTCMRNGIRIADDLISIDRQYASDFARFRERAIEIFNETYNEEVHRD